MAGKRPFAVCILRWMANRVQFHAHFPGRGANAREDRFPEGDTLLTHLRP